MNRSGGWWAARDRSPTLVGGGRALVALRWQLRGAEHGARSAQRRERLVDVPRAVLELDDQRDRGRPRGEQGAQPVIGARHVALDPRPVAPDLGGYAVQDRTEPVPELAERLRQPRDRLRRRAEQTADRRGPLRLDGEPEFGRRRGEPATNRRRRRPAPEGRVQLHGGQLLGIRREKTGRARTGRVEPRDPVGVREARGPGEEAPGTGRAGDGQARAFVSAVPQARSATHRIVRSTTSRSFFSIADRK